MKLQLSQLVKHAAVAPFISQISTLLTDLGATNSELNKMIPKSIREAAAKMKKEKEEQQMIKPTSKKVCKRCNEMFTFLVDFLLNILGKVRRGFLGWRSTRAK